MCPFCKRFEYYEDLALLKSHLERCSMYIAMEVPEKYSVIKIKGR